MPRARGLWARLRIENGGLLTEFAGRSGSTSHFFSPAWPTGHSKSATPPCLRASRDLAAGHTVSALRCIEQGNSDFTSAVHVGGPHVTPPPSVVCRIKITWRASFEIWSCESTAPGAFVNCTGLLPSAFIRQIKKFPVRFELKTMYLPSDVATGF